jgi:hypothetical protein
LLHNMKVEIDAVALVPGRHTRSLHHLRQSARRKLKR